MRLLMETLSSVAAKSTHRINIACYIEKALRSQIETRACPICEAHSHCADEEVNGAHTWRGLKRDISVPAFSPETVMRSDVLQECGFAVPCSPTKKQKRL